MEISKVRENLGKMVSYRVNPLATEHSYVLAAYIFRLDPRNPENVLHDVELHDPFCKHSVIIAPLSEIKSSCSEIK